MGTRPPAPEAAPWHRLDAGEALTLLGTDPARGLTSQEAADRLLRTGENSLPGAPRTSPWKILFAQFQDLMVLILLGATAISYFLGEVVDALTIVAIVCLNAVLGFAQEYRAERSLAALRRLAAPVARVVRDGQLRSVAARELVPGDILQLEAGDRIPADVRLLESFGLAAEESALTGESVPVRKHPRPIARDAVPLGDRRNTCFVGTTLTRGRGRGVVVATGMRTEMGKIAGLIQAAEESKTPLQRRLDQLGRNLVAICLGVSLLVVISGVLRQEPLLDMFMAGVSLAVAAIPEGLPAVVTIGLALGVQRMIRGNAIVRRLPAVETLGCATVICSDKTGTLTKNEMTVKRIFTGGRVYDVSGDGYRPWGEFRLEGGPPRSVRPSEAPDLAAVLTAAALSGNARVGRGRRPGGRRPELRRAAWRSSEEWVVEGDPTEGALVVAAQKGDLGPEALAGRFRRVGEIPFESERRRMTVVYQRVEPGAKGEPPLECFAKGAPDTILDLCRAELVDGRERPLTGASRQEVRRQNEVMAGAALRVLAVARRPLGEFDPESPAAAERDLVFLGLVGMIDPPRPEAVRAIDRCHAAGLRTVMITGDHLATARAIARQMGVLTQTGRSLTGVELDRLSDEELAEVAEEVQVYARVSPQHKLRIVRALRRRGHVVAMTGDGVNDAAAVKEADIGVAMGLSGTDVTKEASAMVLADDNFATIVRAVEEGRSIYDNIRKFIRYLLSCNIGEVLTMFLAAFTGLPLPLLPVQILWVNLVTDGLPAMALGVDPADCDVMQRPPRHPNESVFSRGLGRMILVRGVLIGLATIGVFAHAHFLGVDLARARTLALATLVTSQLIHAFECRSESRGVFEVGLLSNPFLVGAVGISTAMLLVAIYLPALQPVFRTVPLDWVDWGLALAAAGAGGVLLHLQRRIRRRWLRRPAAPWRPRAEGPLP